MLEDDPAPLGLVDPDLRGALDEIVTRAMARDRAARYPSAATLAADLRDYLAGRFVTQVDVSVRRLRRQLQRYRFVTAITVIGALALAGLSSYVAVERARVGETAARFETELGTSRIERGRLLAQTGNLPAAEALVWPEYFHRTDRDYPRWALREIYAHQPVLWTSAAPGGLARTVIFGDDDTQVFTGDDRGAVVVWNAVTGSAITRIDAHRSAVRAIVALPSRDWIVTAGADGTIRAWRRADGAAVREWPKHRAGIRSLTAAPDASALVATDDDGTVTIWPREGGSPAVFTRPGVVSRTAQFDPSGTLLAVGWSDGLVETRRVRTWSVEREWRPHRGIVESIAFSGDGRLIATGSDEGTVGLWDRATLAQVAELRSAHGPARRVAFAPDGSRLAMAGSWGLELWDVATRRRIDPLFGGGEHWVDAAFNHDGGRLATASEDGCVRVWQLQPRPIVASWQLGSSAPPGIAIDAVTKAVTASAGPRDDLSSLARARGNGPGELLARAWGTDGDVAFVSTRASRIIRWSSRNSREEWAVTLPQPASALAVGLDGQRLAAGLSSGGIEIVDARTGARVARLPGHLGMVRGLAFSENGRLLASVGSDGALHLVDVVGARLLMTPAQRDVGATHVMFLPDGRVAVAWDDGRVDLVDPQYFDLHVRGNETYQHARLAR